MPADHAHHLAEHARGRHHQALERAETALTEMADTGEPITPARLAARAGVSRSWIYSQPTIRDRIQQLQRHQADSATNRQTATRASDDSLRHRLAAAHERIAELRRENQELRNALAHAHGQLRAARQSTEDHDRG
jgi:chromosome segregation ATPase